MIFSIQRYLEDYFDRRNLRDADQYAVRIANLYALKRKGRTASDFLKTMRRVRTIFYRSNPHLDRASVESEILRRLDEKFKKKLPNFGEVAFPGGVATERTKLRNLRRRSIRQILRSFKQATESRAVDAIWNSRTEDRLRSRPEKIAQAMLSHFVMGVLTNKRGQLLRELASGAGFVDVVIMFGGVPHLVELKVLRGAFTGVAQLGTYMTTEERHEGWLLVFDTRPPNRRTALPEKVDISAGTVRVVVVDVNPVVPSRKTDPRPDVHVK